MKKIIGFLSLVIIVTTMSCKNDKQTETKVVKEYIVTPPPPPAPPRIIVKDPPEKNTTITLDKNGVKVESKKIDVDIKKQ